MASVLRRPTVRWTLRRHWITSSRSRRASLHPQRRPRCERPPRPPKVRAKTCSSWGQAVTEVADTLAQTRPLPQPCQPLSPSHPNSRPSSGRLSAWCVLLAPHSFNASLTAWHALRTAKRCRRLRLRPQLVRLGEPLPAQPPRRRALRLCPRALPGSWCLGPSLRRLQPPLLQSLRRRRPQLARTPRATSPSLRPFLALAAS